MAEARVGVKWEGRWFCPNCEILLKKPPFKEGGARFHSWKCPSPMVQVDVHIMETFSGPADTTEHGPSDADRDGSLDS